MVSAVFFSVPSTTTECGKSTKLKATSVSSVFSNWNTKPTRCDFTPKKKDLANSSLLFKWLHRTQLGIASNIQHPTCLELLKSAK